MSIKRFDLFTGWDGGEGPEYCDDGEYTDADVTEQLYEALESIYNRALEMRGDVITGDHRTSGELLDNAKIALAAARGEQP